MAITSQSTNVTTLAPNPWRRLVRRLVGQAAPVPPPVISPLLGRRKAVFTPTPKADVVVTAEAKEREEREADMRRLCALRASNRTISLPVYRAHFDAPERRFPAEVEPREDEPTEPLIFSAQGMNAHEPGSPFVLRITSGHLPPMPSSQDFRALSQHPEPIDTDENGDLIPPGELLAPTGPIAHASGPSDRAGTSGTSAIAATPRRKGAVALPPKPAADWGRILDNVRAELLEFGQLLLLLAEQRDAEIHGELDRVLAARRSIATQYKVVQDQRLERVVIPIGPTSSAPFSQSALCPLDPACVSTKARPLAESLENELGRLAGALQRLKGKNMAFYLRHLASTNSDGGFVAAQ